MTSDSTSRHELSQGRWYAWVFWGVVATFTVYEFFIRVTPNAILGQLQEDLNASPGSIASSMSVYLWVYAPMQLLVGVLFDRYGTKYIVSTAAVICGVGCIIFSQADGLVAAGVGRGFIGIGSAFAFVGAVYVATVWFRPHQLAMITGITVAAGMIGDSIGQVPITELVAISSWQQVVFVSGMIGLAIGFIMLVVIPKRPAWFKKQFEQEQLDQAKRPGLATCLALVLKNRRIWLIGAISAILYLPISILAALWGTTYLEKTMGIDAVSSSTLITALLIGFMIGCPVVGKLSDHFGNRTVPLILGAVGGFLAMGLFLLAPQMNMATMLVILFFMGLCTSTQSIAFAVAIEISPRSLAATAVGVCNFITMLAAAGLQNAIGWILNALIRDDGAATAVKAEASHSYDHVTPADFTIAMLALPALFLVSIVLCLMLKRSNTRSVTDST
ncbi:MAG: MFS transporter [Phycisphaerales bacterium]|nr:MFS transporter [Phycisphaerales bacterium]